MIIDVKGTKTDSGKTEGPSYQIEDERSSRTPYVIAAVLLGIAAYLKSAMPIWSRLPPEDEAPVRPEEESHLKLVDAGVMAEPLPSPKPASEGKDGTPRPIGSSSGGNWPPAEFMQDASPALSFADTFIPAFDVSDRPRFQDVVANDNFAPAAGGGAGGDAPPRAGPADDPRDNGEGDHDDGRDDEPTETPPGDDEDNDDDEDGPAASVNRAPRNSGPIHLHDMAGCAAVLIGLSELLANAWDPDGDALSIRNLSVSSGTITRTGTGWLYDPDGVGPVTITYSITDGEASVVQHAYFSVVKNAPIPGTGGDDILVGSECADAIEGCAGNDLIDGRGGDDAIGGGSGDDHIVGGAGNDAMHGGSGNDIILGADGDDRISGGDGDDRLFGDDGDDTVFGDAGNDQIHGGNGIDVLLGGEGHDIVRGDAGDDVVEGDAGDDVLDGGDGADVVAGGDGIDVIEGGRHADLLLDGAGRDTVSGGGGDDHIVVALDGDRDAYDGGNGIDTLDMSGTERGAVIDLAQGVANGSEIGGNDIDGFEVVLGGGGNDTIAGAPGNETLSGGSGDDSLDGDRGCDSVDGDAGNDTVMGGAGNDGLADGTGRDSVSGGDGNDRVVAAADGNDDVFDGGDGSDTLDYSSSEGGIVIDLDEGNASGVDIGNDTIGDFECVVGGSGDDHFVVGSQPVVLGGGTGEDLFEFTPPPPAAGSTPLLHEIIDFEVGDRIRMSKYDLFEEVFDELEDRFEDIYGDRVDEDDARIRVRHERAESIDRTVIEVDLDRDRIYETTIHLDGHRAIVIVEHA
ncbi:calcium-binding protein [Sinorhizobium meliloti]|uniref:Cadherin-like domain-containing protein n=1 Tax=Rhizobium meliloti TaxID=382 RepID=A0A2J0YTC5_RHIML|nr:cadherin-like domain-containing protein [Sinorhizobium meliloti]PJR09116.1 hypothetical protein CEJ86_31860 [Sinorhizobium meliloti]